MEPRVVVTVRSNTYPLLGTRHCVDDGRHGFRRAVCFHSPHARKLREPIRDTHFYLRQASNSSTEGFPFLFCRWIVRYLADEASLMNPLISVSRCGRIWRDRVRAACQGSVTAARLTRSYTFLLKNTASYFPHSMKKGALL